jgi:hypothetical protein
MAKKVLVNGTFPELTSPKAQQSAHGEASEIPTAVRRALEEIFKRDGVKRRKVTHFTLKVSVIDSQTGADED